MKHTPNGPSRTKTDPDRDLRGALHEVSNALTVVLGWLDRAHHDLSDQAGPGLAAVEVARRHAALGHDIARRAVGAPVAENTEVRSSAALMRETVQGVQPVADRRGVRLHIDDEGADVLLPDAPHVLQILLNLLLNAVAFTPPGEAVRLTLRREGNHFLFRVRDEGPGVPPDQRDQLFSVGPSRRPGGAGIGLSYSHRLAESRGGNLALIDGGRGACFELLWPTSDAPSRTHSRSSSAPRMLDGLRVAVLEDDPAVMSLLEFGLGSRGVDLFALTSLPELETFAASGPTIDVALVDLSPISKNPQAAIDALLAGSPNALVYLISGTAVAHDVTSGIAGWIRKPFELGEIFQALARAEQHFAAGS